LRISVGLVVRPLIKGLRYRLIIPRDQLHPQKSLCPGSQVRLVSNIQNQVHK
jgi:hypothetical protein